MKKTNLCYECNCDCIRESSTLEDPIRIDTLYPLGLFKEDIIRAVKQGRIKNTDYLCGSCYEEILKEIDEKF